MTETIGKIEKPEAADFKLGRKLIYVPLIFLPPNDDDAELSLLVKQYWAEAIEQVSKLANSLGGIKRIYHELVPAGAEGLAAIADIGIGSHDLVRALIESGTTLEETEDMEILTEFLDWGHCLSLRLGSSKVFGEVYDNYTKTQQQRNEAISQRITTSLQNDELGLVLLREEHHIQYPSDIQVFYVAPPTLDTLARCLRDRLAKDLPETTAPANDTP